MSNDTISIPELINMLSQLQHKPTAELTPSAPTLAKDVQMVRFESGSRGTIIEQFDRWTSSNREAIIINTHFVISNAVMGSSSEILLVTYKT